MGQEVRPVQRNNVIVEGGGHGVEMARRRRKRRVPWRSPRRMSNGRQEDEQNPFRLRTCEGFSFGFLGLFRVFNGFLCSVGFSWCLAGSWLASVDFSWCSAGFQPTKNTLVFCWLPFIHAEVDQTWVEDWRELRGIPIPGGRFCRSFHWEARLF